MFQTPILLRSSVWSLVMNKLHFQGKIMFVRENNAIKMTQRFNEVHKLRLRPPVCSISVILSQRSSKNSQMENYHREEIRLVFRLRVFFVDVFDEHMRPLFIEVIILMSIAYLTQGINSIINSSKEHRESKTEYNARSRQCFITWMSRTRIFTL